jgi:hypothetical protein
MGRHSASYIAAQQGRATASSASTMTGAARFVGRVGGLALALGIGAAVVGGAGIASADGTTGDGAGGGGESGSAGGVSGAQAAANSAPAESPSADHGTGKDTDTSSVPDVPTMKFDGGVPTKHPRARNTDSPLEAIAKVPPAIASALSEAVSGTRPHTNDKPDTAPRHARPDAPDDTTASTPKSPQPQDDPKPVTVSLVKTAAVTAPVVTAPVITTSAVTTSAVTTLDVPAPVQAPARFRPIATIVSGVLSALGIAPAADPGGAPPAPGHLVVAVLQLIRREIDDFVAHLNAAAAFASTAQAHVPPATATTAPAPGDETQTAYGDIGKWMLESNGQISDYGGQPYQGKTLLEPVNVIIVDPNSTTPAAATARLDTAMFWAGFPAQPIHSTGFQGEIDDVVYGQQPTGLLEGYSDNFFVLPNDHGRIFGPDPVETSSGYVWSGAFSTEALTIYNFLPAHAYVSSNMARTALATRLILSGQATYVGMVPLDNAVDDTTTTTGDHDGYAVVLRLT